MAQDESKNLKKYFENDPPSFFDDLAVKEGEARGEDDVTHRLGTFWNIFSSFRRFIKSIGRSSWFVAISKQRW